MGPLPYWMTLVKEKYWTSWSSLNWYPVPLFSTHATNYLLASVAAFSYDYGKCLCQSFIWLSGTSLFCIERHGIVASAKDLSLARMARRRSTVPLLPLSCIFLHPSLEFFSPKPWFYVGNLTGRPANPGAAGPPKTRSMSAKRP